MDVRPLVGKKRWAVVPRVCALSPGYRVRRVLAAWGAGDQAVQRRGREIRDGAAQASRGCVEVSER
eukprot:2544344-Pleurochrysis_carterae.AAC.1